MLVRTDSRASNGCADRKRYFCAVGKGREVYASDRKARKIKILVVIQTMHLMQQSGVSSRKALYYLHHRPLIDRRTPTRRCSKFLKLLDRNRQPITLISSHVAPLYSCSVSLASLLLNVHQVESSFLSTLSIIAPILPLSLDP